MMLITKKILQDWSIKKMMNNKTGPTTEPRLLNLKRRLSAELLLFSKRSAAPVVTPASTPPIPNLIKKNAIMKINIFHDNIIEIKPKSREIMEIFIILFLPYLSDNLPKRTTANMEKKIPENIIKPTLSKPMLNSLANTGIIGAMDTLDMPSIKLSLKKDIIIFDFSSLFKSTYPVI